MPPTNTRNFRGRVLDLVRQVPPGKVATYGQIALLAGAPQAARQVGQVLHG
ncbi:MAG TPA: MGMT family protein, partial [Trueperaceae bacterium]